MFIYLGSITVATSNNLQESVYATPKANLLAPVVTYQISVGTLLILIVCIFVSLCLSSHEVNS